MKPLEVFQLLQTEELPLILAFPLEEGKGHLITGKGICYIDKIHGSSRVTLGRFSPARLVNYVRQCASFYVTFEAKGTTFGCFLRDLTIDGASITASLPESLKPFMRRFLRVEPSLVAPVILHVRPRYSGTLSLFVRDISECGVGLITPAPLELEGRAACGIQLPAEGNTLVLVDASVVYRADSVHAGMSDCSLRRGSHGVFYGIETFPHSEDQKRIKLYIMRREVEISRLLHE